MRPSFPVRPAFVAFVSWFLLFPAAPALRADTVIMKNGDRLTGTAVKLDAGKLTFKTAYADAIALAWDQVTTLEVEKPLVLPTKGREMLSVTKVERTAAGMVVATASGETTLAPAAVTVLRSPAEEKAYEESQHPDWLHAWTGSANVNLALARGNADTGTFGVAFTAVRATPTDKTSLYANTLYSENAHAVPTTSANTSAGGLRYDHDLKSRVFLFGSGDFLSNALQDLDFRAILAGGGGWHAIKSARETFDILGGLAWTHEVYSPTPTNNFAALDIGQTYSRKLGASSLFTEQTFIYPDVQNIHQVQVAADAKFATRLGKLFNWQTDFTDRYTNFPAPGVLTNDVILTTGLGVTFTRP